MRRVLLSWLVLAWLTACSDRQMLDLTLYVEQIKARPATGIEIPSAPQQVDTFAYVAGDRRDPFAPQFALLDTQPVAVVKQSDSKVKPNLQRRRETLENYPLDSLRMVGTMTRNGARWALVRSQDGVIHRVKVGNHMGERHGRVVEIHDTRMTLIELVQSGNGFQEKRVALGLENVE